MIQKQSSRPLVLGAIALAVALTVVMLLDAGLGAMWAHKTYQIEPVPVPAAPAAARSTPEPVPSPSFASPKVADIAEAQRPEPRRVPVPRSPLVVSMVETQAPGGARQLQRPFLLLVMAGLLGVTAVAAHIASRMRAADGVKEKSLNAQLNPALKW